MNNDNPLKAVLVTLAVAFVCSMVVATAAVTLKPRQQAFAEVERNRHLVEVAGLIGDGQQLTEREVIGLVLQLEARVVDLDAGGFSDAVPARGFDQRAMAANPEHSVAIPQALDIAGLGRRSRYAKAFLLRDDDRITRIVIPVHGPGMWSTLYGFLALEGDLVTIGGIQFYEQAETPGLGDQILDRDWRGSWRGKLAFDSSGTLRFNIARGPIDPGSDAARYAVDGITGATVTITGVDNLVRYWLGPHGFGPFLDNLRKGELVQ